MTQDEKQALVEIQGSRGWLALQTLVKTKVQELDSVSAIDLTSQVGIGIQALAHKKAVKVLKEFLNELGFNPTIKKDNTYE